MANMKKTEILLPAIFAFVGFSIILAGIIAAVSHFSFRKIAVETTAVITEIDRSGDSHYVYVEYTVKGKVYENQLGYYTGGMYVGQETQILYDPDNPGKMSSVSGSRFAFIFLPLFGMIFFSVGGGMIGFRIKRERVKKYLFSHGEIIKAKIKEVGLNTNYSVNRKHPAIVYCSYIHTDGNEYIFKSENIWYDIQSRISEKNIDELTVYVDFDKRKYYVSLKELESNIIRL